MTNLIHDLIAAARAAIHQWRFCRHMRRGGNPDQLPF